MCGLCAKLFIKFLFSRRFLFRDVVLVNFYHRWCSSDITMTPGKGALIIPWCSVYSYDDNYYHCFVLIWDFLSDTMTIYFNDAQLSHQQCVSQPSFIHQNVSNLLYKLHFYAIVIELGKGLYSKDIFHWKSA